MNTLFRNYRTRLSFRFISYSLATSKTELILAVATSSALVLMLFLSTANAHYQLFVSDICIGPLVLEVKFKLSTESCQTQNNRFQGEYIQP